jgi:cold shock protein
MSTGTIKWFSVARKYGFIVPDEGGKDVFLHMSALNTANITYLDDGARVSFELEEASERRSAVNLSLLTTPDVSPVPEVAPVPESAPVLDLPSVPDVPAAAEVVEVVEVAEAVEVPTAVAA